jgi:hypothetical protein
MLRYLSRGLNESQRVIAPARPFIARVDYEAARNEPRFFPSSNRVRMSIKDLCKLGDRNAFDDLTVDSEFPGHEGIVAPAGSRFIGTRR